MKLFDDIREIRARQWNMAVEIEVLNQKILNLVKELNEVKKAEPLKYERIERHGITLSLSELGTGEEI